MTTPRPDVSVVIPTRNRVGMLQQTLATVLGQRDVSVEAIVVDEASSDGTPAFLASLDDPRVKVIRHDDPVRLPGARNAGARLATADLLAFVDDDDLWSRDKLSAQLAAMRETGAAWSYVGAVHVGERMEPVAVQRAPEPSQVADILRRYNVIPGGGSGVVVTRAAFETAGPFDETLHAAEDWECWLRLALSAGAPAAVDRPLLAYRRLPNSMSHEIDRMLEALRRVADLHPDVIERDPVLGVPAGTARGLARLAREAGDRKAAAGLIWRDRHNRGTLLRAPLYLGVPLSVMRGSFQLRRGQLNWSRPLLDELTGPGGVAADDLSRPRTIGVINLDDHPGNPYLQRLVDALEGLGVHSESLALRPGQLVRARRRGVRTIHVHWPEYLVLAPDGSGKAQLRAVVAFARLVVAARLCRPLGMRLVWTVHNPRPHDPDAHWTARRAYGLIARLADAFITHSHDAARRAGERFSRMPGRTFVAAHGNYTGSYASASVDARAVVRARYGVPEDAALLLAFGQVRPYKRLVELVELVQAAPGLQLLVAGAPVGTSYAEELSAAAAGGDRIHLDLRRIPDEEVAELYAAADVAVLHYTEVFSSGALLLALSAGVPAVSPYSAAADEVAGPPALVMYRDDHLSQAVADVMDVPAAQRRDAALAAAAAASWEAAAAEHLRAYGVTPLA